MKKELLKKTLVIGIIVLFVSVSVSPVIAGESFKSNTNKIEVNNDSQETFPITFHSFDKSGIKQKQVTLPKNIAEDISNSFEELKQRFISDPLSDVTKNLLIEFIDILEFYDLIPEDLSKKDVISLLNPPWLKFLQKFLKLSSKTPYLRSPVLNYLNNYLNVDEDNTKSKFIEPQNSVTRTVLLSNIVSYGLGIPFPLFMLPRPRGFAAWIASNASTYVGSLIQKINFYARGNQQALALGFMGIGISIYFGFFVYGLIGYVAVLIIKAEKFE